MAIALGVHALASHATAATTAARTTQASGSTILYLCGYTSTFTSLSDSKGNVPTIIGTEVTGPSGWKMRALRQYNATGGASHTATLTADNCTLHVIEIKGAPTTSALDQTNNVGDSATPFLSPSITTTQANEILIGWTVCDGSTGSTFTHGNSFVEIESETDGNQYWPSASSSRIVSATGSYNTSVTIASSPANTQAWIFSIKEASAGTAIAILAQAHYRRRRTA